MVYFTRLKPFSTSVLNRIRLKGGPGGLCRGGHDIEIQYSDLSKKVRVGEMIYKSDSAIRLFRKAFYAVTMHAIATTDVN